MTLTGILGPDGIEDADDEYGFSNFATETGPTGEFQALWTLSAPVAADKLVLTLDGSSANGMTDLSNQLLDGEWLDGVSIYPSGDRDSGGRF